MVMMRKSIRQIWANCHIFETLFKYHRLCFFASTSFYIIIWRLSILSSELLSRFYIRLFKGCTAYCLNFSEFQKNQLLLQIFSQIDKRMKFPKVMFSVNVVVSFV